MSTLANKKEDYSSGSGKSRMFQTSTDSSENSKNNFKENTFFQYRNDVSKKFKVTRRGKLNYEGVVLIFLEEPSKIVEKYQTKLINSMFIFNEKRIKDQKENKSNLSYLDILFAVNYFFIDVSEFADQIQIISPPEAKLKICAECGALVACSSLKTGTNNIEEQFSRHFHLVESQVNKKYIHDQFLRNKLSHFQIYQNFVKHLSLDNYEVPILCSPSYENYPITQKIDMRSKSDEHNKNHTFSTEIYDDSTMDSEIISSNDNEKISTIVQSKCSSLLNKKVNHSSNVEFSTFYFWFQRNSPNIWKPIPEQSKGVPIINQSHEKFSGYYYRIIGDDEKFELKKIYQRAFDEYVLISEKKNQAPQHYIDARYQKVSAVVYEQKIGSDIPTLCGIRITNGKMFEEIVTTNMQYLNELFGYFREYGILENIENYYKLDNILGQGSYSTIYKITCHQSSEEFALKKQHADKKTESLGPGSIVYEIDLLRKISTHKNRHCINLKAIFEDETGVYCVNDYYKGGSLKSLMEKNPHGLNEVECQIIIRQLFKALVFLDKNSIIHRDVKPENIVLRNNGSIDDAVLIDMGFAITKEDALKTYEPTSCFGSPGFIAPEMCCGLPYCHKSDMFGAGVTLYILMTNQHPFDAENSDQVQEKNIRCKPNFNINKINGLKDFFSNEIIELLKGLITNTPACRLAASKALLHPAFNILNELSNVATKTNDDVSNILKCDQQNTDKSQSNKNNGRHSYPQVYIERLSFSQSKKVDNIKELQKVQSIKETQ